MPETSTVRARALRPVPRAGRTYALGAVIPALPAAAAEQLLATKPPSIELLPEAPVATTPTDTRGERARQEDAAAAAAATTPPPEPAPDPAPAPERPRRARKPRKAAAPAGAEAAPSEAATA